MDKLDQYIDGLFHDKLSEAVKPESFSEMEWVRLKKSIQSKNFFRFSAGSFNVYYLSIAICAVVTCGALFIKNSPKNIEIINHENNIIISDSIESENNENIKEKNFQDDCLFENKKDTISKHTLHEGLKCKGEDNNIKVGNIDPIRKDDQKNETTLETTIDTIHEITPIEEKVEYMPEQVLADTVFVIDTIKVTKKQLKFSRKR